MTLGWYESQLLSRVDPQGRTLGRFFAEEVAAALEAEFYIGLPDDVPDERIATIHAFKPPEMLLNLGKMRRPVLLGMLNPRGGGVLSRSMRCFPELMQPEVWNRRESLRVEAPSVDGTGEPRAIARIYGALATDGDRLGIAGPTRSELEQPASEPTSGRRDVVLGLDGSYAMGFLKPSPAMRFGSSSRAFGTPGGGGSQGFADPETAVGYAYAMNRLGFHMPVDPRELAIRNAFYKPSAPPRNTVDRTSPRVDSGLRQRTGSRRPQPPQRARTPTTEEQPIRDPADAMRGRARRATRTSSRRWRAAARPDLPRVRT